MISLRHPHADPRLAHARRCGAYLTEWDRCTNDAGPSGYCDDHTVHRCDHDCPPVGVAGAVPTGEVAGMTRPSHLDPSRSAPVCGPGGTGGTPCWLCRAPIVGEPPCIVNHVTWPSEDTKAHGKCADAWLDRDTDALKRFRDEACADGHHRYPGAWSPDPTDPFGDAGMWECAKGCGFVQHHPGYGVGRALAEYEARAAPC